MISLLCSLAPRACSFRFAALLVRLTRSLKVSGLLVTPEGAQLVSAGEEAVLVLWNLQDASSQKVPRFGAPIEHIALSDDAALIALVLGNNSIRPQSA